MKAFIGNNEEEQQRVARSPRSSVRHLAKIAALSIAAGFWLLTRNASLVPPPPPTRSLTDAAAAPKVVVAALVPDNEGDLFDLCLALKSLDERAFLSSSRPTEDAPALIFSEGGLSDEAKSTLEACAGGRRAVSFPRADFSFPPGFDPAAEAQKTIWAETNGHVVRASNMGTRLGRDPWGYVQMIRFWTTGVWTHPSASRYDVVFRVDSDSCFTDRTELLYPRPAGLPYLTSLVPDAAGVYQSVFNEKAHKWAEDYVEGLFDFALRYTEERDVIPAYPELWEKIRSTWENTQQMVSFKTNVETGRVDFFTREDVMQWHRALTEEKPFGVLRYRWGDSEILPITIALFAKKEEVRFITEIPGYDHKRGICQDFYGIEGERTLENVRKFMSSSFFDRNGTVSMKS